jgi:hypothetical protein
MMVRKAEICNLHVYRYEEVYNLAMSPALPAKIQTSKQSPEEFQDSKANSFI